MKGFMLKRESNFAVLFRHWLKANPQKSASYELKDTRGKRSFTMSELKQEQIDYALAIESDRGVLLRTVAVSAGMPDYIYLRGERAFIAIRYPEGFVVISIKAFLKEREKLLTWSRACVIASSVVVL